MPILPIIGSSNFGKNKSKLPLAIVLILGLIVVGFGIFIYGKQGNKLFPTKVPPVKTPSITESLKINTDKLSFDSKASKDLFFLNIESYDKQSDKSVKFGYLYRVFGILVRSYSQTHDSYNREAAEKIKNFLQSDFQSQAATRSAELKVDCFDQVCKKVMIPNEIVDLKKKVEAAAFRDPQLKQAVLSKLDEYPFSESDDKKLNSLTTAFQMLRADYKVNRRVEIRNLATEIKDFIAVHHSEFFKKFGTSEEFQL